MHGPGSVLRHADFSTRVRRVCDGVAIVCLFSGMLRARGLHGLGVVLGGSGVVV
jgi:hypothetical protein